MDPQSLLGLGSTLMGIDEQKFRQVVGLLEQINDNPEVQRTFSLIRPRLAELRPKRRPTFKRLFCDPFEDLFEAPAGVPATPLSTIDRGVVNTLWPLVEGQIGADRLHGFTDALGEGPGQEQQARVFWDTAALAVAGIAEQLETGRFADALEIRLNPHRIRAIQDIGHLLAIAPTVQELKAVLAPKPVGKLYQEHLDGIQSIGRTVARRRPDALKSFILVAAARLSDPSILLSGLWEMDLGQKASDRAALFLDLSGTVVSQIEGRSRTMAGAPAATADHMAVANLAVDLIASLDATRSAMEQSRNKDFDHRLKSVRDSVHEMVRSQVIDGAETGIMAAIATPADSPTDHDERRDTLLRAESRARALRKCSTIADTLGLRGEMKTVAQKTTSSLADTARQVLGNGAGDARTGYTAIRMIELIAGPGEANQIMDEILRSGMR